MTATHFNESGETVALSNLLSKNLVTLLKQNRITESRLAKALNIPYNTIRRLVGGITADPRISTLKLIADYFNVGIDSLTTAENLILHTTSQNGPQRSVPIIGWDHITKKDFLTTADFLAWPHRQPIALTDTQNLSKYAYAIESKKSMRSQFPVGSLFIVDPIASVIDNDLVLVIIKESNAITLRSLVIDPPYWHLQSIIENSPPLIFDANHHEIAGVVVLTILTTRKL